VTLCIVNASVTYIWKPLFMAGWECRFASTAGLESCQNAEGVFKNGNQAEPARDPVALDALSGGRRSTAPHPVNSEARGWNYFQPRRPTISALNSLGSGVASWIFGRALRNGRHGDGTVALALLAARSIVRQVLRSTTARTSPIFSKDVVLCDPMGFWRVGALFVHCGHTSFWSH
jgi:hypothetical protein